MVYTQQVVWCTFSLVSVQLDLVNPIPSFHLPGSAWAYACYCLLDDRVGVGWGVQGGGLLGIMSTKSSPRWRRATWTSLCLLLIKHVKCLRSNSVHRIVCGTTHFSDLDALHNNNMLTITAAFQTHFNNGFICYCSVIPNPFIFWSGRH